MSAAHFEPSDANDQGETAVSLTESESEMPFEERALSLRGLELAAKAPYLLISLAVLVADQWTKWLIEVHLPHHTIHPVIPGLLNLSHVRNTGVAFGLFATPGTADASWVLAALGAVALLIVGAYFMLTHTSHRLLLAALALVMGGAVGNLIDRVAAGAVTDFIDLYVGSYHWPSFNIADSAITIGIVLMAADAFRPRGPADGDGGP